MIIETEAMQTFGKVLQKFVHNSLASYCVRCRLINTNIIHFNGNRENLHETLSRNVCHFLCI